MRLPRAGLRLAHGPFEGRLTKDGRRGDVTLLRKGERLLLMWRDLLEGDKGSTVGHATAVSLGEAGATIQRPFLRKQGVMVVVVGIGSLDERFSRRLGKLTCVSGCVGMGIAISLIPSRRRYWNFVAVLHNHTILVVDE